MYDGNTIPSLVHFTWYGEQQTNEFRFHHLISVLAIYKVVRPERIYFWFDVPPEGVYFKQLREKVPEVVLIHRKEIFGQTGSSKYIKDIIRLEVLLEYGGIHCEMDAIGLRSLDALLRYGAVLLSDSAGRLYSGVVLASRWARFLKVWYNQYKTYADQQRLVHADDVISGLVAADPQLVHVEQKVLVTLDRTDGKRSYGNGDSYDWRTNTYFIHLLLSQQEADLNPTRIKTLNTTVAAIFRHIYYGSSAIIPAPPQTVGLVFRMSRTANNSDSKMLCLEENICHESLKVEYFTYRKNEMFSKMFNSKLDLDKNIKHEQRVVPSIVHFTWYGGPRRNHFRFHHMMAILAAHKFIKPNRIFLWIDMVPEGSYFDEVRQKVPELFLVQRDPPTEIYGVPIIVPEHASDIVRLEVLLEFGGIYLDLDAMAVKSLDPLLNYEMVMGYEEDDSLCNGVMIAAPWTEFLRIWHFEYHSFVDSQWAEHSVLVPARLAKHYTNLIHTEQRSFHRPNWRVEGRGQLYDTGKIYDWKNNNYIVHIWIRYHKTEHDPEDIKTWDTTVGQIFRYIYYGTSDIIK